MIRSTRFNGRIKQMPETTQPFERQERLTSVEEFLQTHRGVLNNRRSRCGCPSSSSWRSDEE
jgi:hypothetical protein